MEFFTKEERQLFTAAQAAAIEEALTRALHKAVEDAIVSIPYALTGVVKMKASLEKTQREFLDKHKDLKPYADRLVKIAADVETDNPGMSPAQILDASAEQLRKDLAASSALENFTPTDTAKPSNLLLDDSVDRRQPWVETKNSDE